jgi:hypothetical protein
MSFSYQPINNKKAHNKQNKRYAKVHQVRISFWTKVHQRNDNFAWQQYVGYR